MPMWVWIAIGVAVWIAVSVLIGLALGRFFGALRRRVAAQRAELREREHWADRPPDRATKDTKSTIEANEADRARRNVDAPR
jgi:hypothetical protein